MAASKKITIQEIADQAKVSIATVSRIINHTGIVKEETRNRVLEVMEELNFHPKSNDTLADERSTTILVCIPDLTNPFYAPVLEGIQQSASYHNYHVLLFQSKDTNTDADELENILKTNSIAGVILLTSVSNSLLVKRLCFRCPVVMCSEHCEDSNISFVSIDDYAAAKNATKYLLAAGRKNIAMLNSSMQYKYARHRERGFRDALLEAGITPNEDWILHLSSMSYNLAMANAAHLLQQENRPDAIFTSADMYALGVLRAAHKLHLHVPNDLALIGFDNLEIATMAEPPITTVKQPCKQIGFQSAELLIEQIENPECEPKQIIMDTELIVRGSTPLTIS